MTPMPDDGGRTPGDRILVEAPARLHFGMLDLGGSLGRSFGGIGAAVPAPSLLLEASAANGLRADGPESERVLEFARRFLAFHRLECGAHFRVLRAMPAHAGLGSGTQLALAVARALAELHGIAADAVQLARAVGRARRSAIGTWVFAHGGFVLEGGRRAGSDAPAPLLAQLPVPERWRCVIAIPRAVPGMSGEAETTAFADLPLPPVREAERVAHLVLMKLLPALVEAELPAFGGALTEIQRITGRWFAPAQGGIFAPGPTADLVRLMAEWGAAGVGQSSWGPAVYGIVGDAAAGAALAERVQAVIEDGAVYEGGFASGGATVRRVTAPVGKG
jgi:beta-ribofuranosylaminobenzene 5'-phosphate synthase